MNRSPRVETQPRRGKSIARGTERRSLSALCGGKAAGKQSETSAPGPRVSPSPRLRVSASPHLPVPPSVLLCCFLLSALCLLPSAFSSLAQNEIPQSSPAASPSPQASPSPSPTPPPNLHQWGAVTSFHGLPSDRTHAIAQTQYGVTWFATDGGLARFDGRRTNAINDEGLPVGRVLALKTDETGALWIGTDNGVARMANGKFDQIKETAGVVINSIISPERDRVIMASDSGQIFDCSVKQDATREL